MNTKKQELAKNDLADSLEAKLEQLRPYGNAILVGFAAILLVVVGYFWFQGKSEQQSANQWASLLNAIDSLGPNEDTKMKEVANDYSDSAAGIAAHYFLGRNKLGDGLQKFYRDRKTGTDEIKEAVKEFTTIVDSQVKNDGLKLNARFSRGYAYEALGDFEKAKEDFKAVAEAEATDVRVAQYAKQAVERLDRSPYLKDFYASFASTKPVAPGSSLGPTDDPESLPTRPDISFPNDLESTPAPTEPATTNPANSGGGSLQIPGTPAGEPTKQPEATTPPATPSTTPPAEATPAPADGKVEEKKEEPTPATTPTPEEKK